MKNSIVSIVIGIMGILIMQCNRVTSVNNPKDESFAKDGQASIIASEVNSMGSLMYGKLIGTYRDVHDSGEINIIPWKYDSTINAWVRSSEINLQNFTGSRRDTISFFDVNNAPLIIPTLEKLDHIQHIRKVHSQGKNTFDHLYTMNITIAKTALDTQFIFNGTMVGTWNQQPLSSTVITGLKRTLVLLPIPYLSFPSEGTIASDLPLKTISIVFSNSNATKTAQVTVVRKSDGKQWNFTINLVTYTEQ